MLANESPGETLRARYVHPGPMAEEIGIPVKLLMRWARLRRIPSVKFSAKVIMFDRELVLEAIERSCVREAVA